MTAAVLEAGRWIDSSLSNRQKTAQTVADKSYVNTDSDVIVARMLGRYDNGIGKKWDDPDYMKFYNDGAVNYPVPVRRHVVHDPAPALGPAERRPRLSGGGEKGQPHRRLQAGRGRDQDAVAEIGFRTSKLIDGVVWDGKEPEEIRRQLQDQGGLR